MDGIRLRKILIQNFRGIKKLEVDISDTTVFIGENNTGKTAVMNAIQKCLKDLNARRASVFEYYDFYLNAENGEPAEPIRIELTFSEDAIGDWQEGIIRKLNNLRIIQVNDQGLSKVTLRVSCEFDTETREFKQNWAFLNEADEELSNISESALSTFQHEVAFFYLPALRAADKHFEARGPYWAPFLKNSTLTPEKRTEIESKLKEVNDLVVDSHDSFKQVSELLDSLRDLLPMSAEKNVSIDAVPSRILDILKKAQVSLGAVSGAKVPVNRHGEGTQSLAVLMLFSAFLSVYAERFAIIALEEPEAHLHPSAIRTLWKSINSLPGQRLVSTHSGDLISEVNIYNVRRFAFNGSGLTCHRIEGGTLTQDETRKLSYYVRSARGELLFARAWLLVEGQTETWIFPAAAKASKIDLHKEGIRLVEYGQSDVGLLAKVANSFGIPWICVLDNDSGRRDYEPKVLVNLGIRTSQECLRYPYRNPETYFPEHGFISVYSSFMSAQNLAKIKKSPSDTGYWEEYADNFPNSKKVRAAVGVAMEMETRGPSSVTIPIKEIIDSVVDLAKGDG